MKKLIALALVLLFSLTVSSQEVYPKLNPLLKGTAEYAQYKRTVKKIRANMDAFLKSEKYKAYKKEYGIDSTFVHTYLINMYKRKVYIKFEKKLTREQLNRKQINHKI